MEEDVFEVLTGSLQGEELQSTGKRVFQVDIVTVFGYISTRPN